VGFSNHLGHAVGSAAAVPLLIGGIMLCAWLAGLAPRWSAAGTVTMKTNASLALLLAGGALILLHPYRRAAWGRQAGTAGAALISAIGVLTLSQHLFGWNLGIDELLAREVPGAAAPASPNRMGPVASTCLTLTGVALLLLRAGRRRLVPYLALAIVLIALVPALGMIFDIPQFYDLPHLTAIAWPTVISLVALGIGLVLACPESGPLPQFLRDDPGGNLFRQRLAISVVAPVAMGLLVTLGVRRGLYTEPVGTGLLILALIVILSFTNWRSAQRISELGEVRRRADDRIRASDERLRLAKETAGLGVHDYDVRTGTLACDERSRELWGMGSAGRIDLETWLAALHPDDREPTRAALHQALDPRGGGRFVAEYRIAGRDGERDRWVAATGQASFAGGQPRRLIGTVQDVTRRREVEETLKTRERFLDGILGSITDPFMTLDESWRCTFANEALARLLGTIPGELLGRNVWEVLPEDAGRESRPALFRSMAQRASVEYDADYPEWKRSFQVVAYPMEDGGLAVFLRDVTALKGAEAALRESENRVRTLGEAAPMIVSLADAEGRIAYVNEFCLEFTGKPSEAFAGDGWLDSVHAEDRVRTREAWYRAVSAGAPFEAEYRFGAADGTWRWLLARGRPVRGPDGHIAHWVACAVDVHAGKSAEEAAREADRRKDEFLAVLSHELRNPLAPITNCLYILDRAVPGGEEARNAQVVLERQVRQLARMVDDLLDVTRIAQGKIRLQRTRVDLDELARRTIEDHRTLFEARDIDLQFEPTDGPVLVDGDWSRLGQALGNLLQNAAKFTERNGRVVVSLGVDAAAREAVLKVADTGVGITSEVLHRMFEPFVQADRTLDRSKGGLGLGLALVKGIVELHDGRIVARSAGRERGSEFVLRIPLELSRSQPSDVKQQGRAPVPRRVLIIEDNVDAAQSLRMLLGFSGHEVEVAYDGPEGIEKALDFRPEVILCDIGLPDMDGYDVARTLRSDPRTRDAFLVALSGYALPEDLQRAAAAGFDRHVAKPPHPERLQDVLADVPRRQHARGGMAAQRSGGAGGRRQD